MQNGHTQVETSNVETTPADDKRAAIVKRLDAAQTIYASAKARAIAECYVNADKEGTRKGRSVARKQLNKAFEGMTPDEIVAWALETA